MIILIKLQKVISVYNKPFVQKNKKHLHDLFTQFTLQLKQYMKNKFFHAAYKQFMVLVVKEIPHLSADALKAPEKTARKLIHDHFPKLLAALAKKDEKKKTLHKYPPLKQHKGKGKHH